MADTCNVYDSSLFANCLTDLSIPELLKLQHSIQKLPDEDYYHMDNSHINSTKNGCMESENDQCDKPSSMALVAEGRGYEYFQPESWPVETKPSKLQTIFQISITTMAFLSFGGYLLCLIIQSIKSKGTTFLHAVPSTIATTNGVKRIKVYRRSRRSSLPPPDVAPGYYNMDSFSDYSNHQPHNLY